MVQIRTPAGQRIFPLWNTQGIADAIAAHTGATNFGTYLGHSPTAERATDCFTTIPMPRSNMVLGDAVAEFLLTGKMPNGISVWDWFGVRYIIWRQRINWNDGNGWSAMEDRGGDTNNHFDHDHISVNVIPAPTTQPIPPININGGSEEVLILNVKDTGIFLLRGSVVSHLQHPDHVLQWVKAGVPYQDKVEMTRQVFSAYTGWTDTGSGAIRGLTGKLPDTYNSMVAAVRSGMDDIHDEYVRSLTVK